MEIKYLDPEKKTFEGCLYMGWSFDPDFMNKRSFPYLWRLDIKFGFFSQAV